MSLSLVGVNWQGEMVGQLATLISMGANDFTLFHFLPTKTGLVQFPYAEVDTQIRTFESICDVQDEGGRSKEVVKAICVKFIVQESACYDEQFATDWANASGAYNKQTLGNDIATWVRSHVNNFMRGLQNVRWSGDVTLPTANLLSKHDGVARKIIAKGAFSGGNPRGYHLVTTNTVSATNASQEVGKVIDAITDIELKGTEGYKIIVSGTVANFMLQQKRNNNFQTGLTALPTLSYNTVTGQLSDKTYFGAPVYVAKGLDAGFPNAIICGMFVDGIQGVAKCAVLNPREGARMEIREIKEGDAVRFRAIHLQIVEVMPNLSQVASNLA